MTEMCPPKRGKSSIRREAYEQGIEKEAERQGALAERIRYRMNELMTVAYGEAMRWLEEVGASSMRASDVIQITRLHLEAVKTFSVAQEPEEEGWSEEDDRDLVERILPQVEAVEDPQEWPDGESRPDEELESDRSGEGPEEGG